MTLFYVNLKICSIQVLKSPFSFHYKIASQNISTKVIFFLIILSPGKHLPLFKQAVVSFSLSLFFLFPFLPSEVLSSNFCELGLPVALCCFGYHASFDQLFISFPHWFEIIFWGIISIIYPDLLFGPQRSFWIFSGETSSGSGRAPIHYAGIARSILISGLWISTEQTRTGTCWGAFAFWGLSPFTPGDVNMWCGDCMWSEEHIYC